MKKLKLQLEELDVQSFRVDGVILAEAGTVRGHAVTRLDTCQASCGPTACSDPLSCAQQTCFCG
ncbi:MAG TPA: hypothetical protein VF092_16620 [Longimicrobium sp.]